MSQHVQFDEGEDMAYQAPSQKKSFLMRIAMKLGAKDERQANIALLGTAVVFFIIAGILFARLPGFGIGPSTVTDEAITPELLEESQ